MSCVQPQNYPGILSTEFVFKSVFRGEGNPSWNGQAEKKYEHSVNNNSHTFGSVQGGSQNNKQTNKRKIAQMQVY